MNAENNLGPSSTKDKPIIPTGLAGHPQLAQLPEWPTRTIAVLSTIDEGPQAIPVAAPVRAGDQRPTQPLALLLAAGAQEDPTVGL